MPSVAVPVSVSVPPVHMLAEDSDAVTPVGAPVQPGSTVTVACCPVMVAVQPDALVALVILYVVVVTGVTDTMLVPDTSMVVDADPPPVHA